MILLPFYSPERGASIGVGEGLTAFAPTTLPGICGSVPGRSCSLAPCLRLIQEPRNLPFAKETMGQGDLSRDSSCTIPGVSRLTPTPCRHAPPCPVHPDLPLIEQKFLDGFQYPLAGAPRLDIDVLIVRTRNEPVPSPRQFLRLGRRSG